MSGEAPRRLRFAYFTAFDPGGSPQVMWDQPRQVGFDYLNLGDWADLVKSLERARFDAIFWADHIGVHDEFEKSWKPAVRQAVQFPMGDPVLLTAALAGATEHLGFAFSANIIQDHPYMFAKRLSTLDHLTKGRIAWNIVTSFQQTAWRNLGHSERADHAERYIQAEEYLDVLYKLLEGSWEDDAVVRDTATRSFADPERVHAIEHAGKYYTIPGIHTVEPSPQRMPVLFQAGTSDDGRDFSARNAEAVFIKALDAKGFSALLTDMNERLARNGRRPEDLLYFQAVKFVVGSTEEEAQRKDAELQEYLNSDTNLVMQSSMMGIDLAGIDLDTPIGDFTGDAIQGKFKMLADSAPDKAWTFRQVVAEHGTDRIVGTPDQIADHLELWRDAGVAGINITNFPGTADMHDFLENVTPTLQDRGLLQREYGEGTLREQLFRGHSDEASGPRLNQRHPASGYRRTRA